MRTLIVLCLLAAMASGCRSTYYNVWQKLGWEKRDILVDRVKDARDEQQAAKEQFKTTLQRFQEITGFKGGDLESKYNKLNADYERSQARAEAVRKQIASVETVAKDLFNEWEVELDEYENAELKRTSQQKLRETRDRYGQLVASMRRSEQKMQPVLSAFKDQVLFLKHNLNAQAIASLQTTSASIDQEVQALIRDMEASIAEANEFIQQMKS